jgi:hypothetical protein
MNIKKTQVVSLEQIEDDLVILGAAMKALIEAFAELYGDETRLKKLQNAIESGKVKDVPTFAHWMLSRGYRQFVLSTITKH